MISHRKVAFIPVNGSCLNKCYLNVFLPHQPGEIWSSHHDNNQPIYYVQPHRHVLVFKTKKKKNQELSFLCCCLVEALSANTIQSDVSKLRLFTSIRGSSKSLRDKKKKTHTGLFCLAFLRASH